MEHTYQLKTQNAQLTLSLEHGGLESIEYQGIQIPLSGFPLVAIGMRNAAGDLVTLTSLDFNFHFSQNGDMFSFMYSECSRYPDLSITIYISVEKSFFNFRPEVRNIPSGILLEWIDVPQITIPSGGEIFWPHAEGVLIDDPQEREKSPWSRYHVLGFLGRTEGLAYSEGGYYPGVCQMQFIAWQKNGAVLYFGAHDRSHGTKAVEYAPQKDGSCRFSLQTFCGGTGEDYIADFDYVLGMFDGDWMDACSVYRDWIKEDPALPERGKLPEMVKESPIVMIYPVRGSGDDKGKMTEGNEYFPYCNGLPNVEKYEKLFESRILALLMHWEGTAPWAPPYVWPPFGGVENLKQYSDELHARGNYLGVYCSGSAWTQQSCIVDYSREEECDKENLRRHMIRGPKGEIEAVVCCAPQAQRLGFDMCLTEEWCRRTLKEELAKLISVDIDYAQFFDQNLGGAYHTCYSREHSHPAVPGRWQTVAMKSLLTEMTEDLLNQGSDMVVGCEAAAADIYLKELPFNDLRGNWNWGRGIPVPGYQFVFHEYCNNFMGNQCGITDVIDSSASPENLLYRTAYSFISGDLLSIVLKEEGKIHWGWGALWQIEEPNQDQVVTLIRNLNRTRIEFGKFLQYGRMEKPKIRIKTEEYCLCVNGKDISVPSCLHSAWVAPDGARAEFLVNYLPKNQKVHCRYMAEHQAEYEGRPFVEDNVELPPLTAVIFYINP